MRSFRWHAGIWPEIWVIVTFRNMGMGDCELVEDFARQILPKLAVRDLREDIACVPHQESASRYLIRGRILKPLPRAEQSR